MNTTRSDIEASRQTTSADGGRDESIPGLLSSLGSDIGDLVGVEMRLARSEIGESINDAKAGAASLASAFVVLLCGALILLAACCLALEALTGLSLWVSTLVVGLVVTVTGAVLVQTGKKKLSADSLAPTRTQESLEKDKSMVERRAQ